MPCPANKKKYNVTVGVSIILLCLGTLNDLTSHLTEPVVSKGLGVKLRENHLLQTWHIGHNTFLMQSIHHGHYNHNISQFFH